ncbi:MAG: hypothetical protein V2B19_31490 [Pseudomonadota bacterium]
MSTNAGTSVWWRTEKNGGCCGIDDPDTIAMLDFLDPELLSRNPAGATGR